MTAVKNFLSDAIRAAKSAVGYIGYIVLNVVFMVACIPALFLPNCRMRSRYISFLMHNFLKFICFVFLPSLDVYKIAEISGLQNIGGAGRIYVSNHASLLDSLLLLALVPNCGIVVKSKYSSWLAVGFLIRFFDFVAVDPSKPSNVETVLSKSREILSEGKSVIIFPEGQRSPSRRVLNFHKLAFKLSFESGVALVPTVVYSTKPILAKGQRRFSPEKGCRFYIEFMPCEYPADYKNADMLSHSAYQKIAKKIAALRAERE